MVIKMLPNKYKGKKELNIYEELWKSMKKDISRMIYGMIHENGL